MFPLLPGVPKNQRKKTGKSVVPFCMPGLNRSASEWGRQCCLERSGSVREFDIRLSLRQWCSYPSLSRRSVVVARRMNSDRGQRTACGETVRLGVTILSEHRQDFLRYTGLTHGCLLIGEPTHVCNQCGVPLVSHSAGMPNIPSPWRVTRHLRRWSQ
jgi:hypothetical protein